MYDKFKETLGNKVKILKGLLSSSLMIGYCLHILLHKLAICYNIIKNDEVKLGGEQ